ncbi:MAG: FGGY-family carbohydrate kinase [Chloroflexi bacterium]|nr:FGGY-family carbohydrate kinase [Chloroflexota bacterium]
MPGNKGPLIVAIDLGSSGIRAAVARPTGPPLAVVRGPLQSFRPEGAPELAREFDPDLLRRAVGTVIRSALRQAGASKGSVSALAVTSQREGIALLDRAGKTLYVGPNNDLRGAFQGAAIDDTHASLIWSTTGHLPSFMLAWSKLSWFRAEAPTVYGRIAHVASLADWLVYELTGELRLERALGVEGGLVDVVSGKAANELMAGLGFEGIRLPEPIDAGEVAGRLVDAISRDYGLPEHVPVVIAGPDTQVGLAGMGVAGNPGIAGDWSIGAGILAGWSGVVQRATDRTVLDRERGLWAGRHVLPGCWILEGNTGVMGGAFEWLVRLVSDGRARPEDFAALDRAASRKGRGAGSVSAHLGPDLLNLSKSGLRAGGIVFPVPLTLEPPDAGALGRAAIENFAFAIRASLDRIDGVAGSPTASVAVGGGMTRSAAFRRVVADVVKRPVRIGRDDASLIGAITLAATAVGEGPGLIDALRLRARSCRPIEPDPLAAEEYEGLFEQWKHRGDILKQIGL